MRSSDRRRFCNGTRRRDAGYESGVPFADTAPGDGCTLTASPPSLKGIAGTTLGLVIISAEEVVECLRMGLSDGLARVLGIGDVEVFWGSPMRIVLGSVDGMEWCDGAPSVGREDEVFWDVVGVRSWLDSVLWAVVAIVASNGASLTAGRNGGAGLGAAAAAALAPRVVSSSRAAGWRSLIIALSAAAPISLLEVFGESISLGLGLALGLLARFSWSVEGSVESLIVRPTCRIR